MPTGRGYVIVPGRIETIHMLNSCDMFCLQIMRCFHNIPSPNTFKRLETKHGETFLIAYRPYHFLFFTSQGHTNTRLAGPSAPWTDALQWLHSSWSQPPKVVWPPDPAHFLASAKSKVGKKKKRHRNGFLLLNPET